MKLSANSFLRALVGPFESTDLVKSHRKQCSGRQTRVQICMGATDDTYDRIGVYSTLCKEHCGTLATRKPTAAMAASYHAKLDAFNEVNKAVERIIGSADRMAEELAGMSKLRPIAGLPDSVATELQEIIDGAITKLESIDPSALRRYRAGINPGIATPALTPTQSARQRKTSATAKTKLTAPTPRSRVKRPGKTKQSSHKETSRLDKKGKGKEKAHTPAAPTSAGSSVNDELVNAAVPISSDESEGLDESVELTLLKPMGDSEELESAESSIFTAFIYTKAHEDAKKFLFYAPVASCLEFTQYPAPAGRGFNYFSVNSSEYKSADDPISLERRGEYMIYRKHGLRSVECPGIGEYEAQALHSAEKCEAEALKSAAQRSRILFQKAGRRRRYHPAQEKEIVEIVFVSDNTYFLCSRIQYRCMKTKKFSEVLCWLGWCFVSARAWACGRSEGSSVRSAARADSPRAKAHNPPDSQGATSPESRAMRHCVCVHLGPRPPPSDSNWCSSRFPRAEAKRCDPVSAALPIERRGGTYQRRTPFPRAMGHSLGCIAGATKLVRRPAGLPSTPPHRSLDVRVQGHDSRLARIPRLDADARLTQLAHVDARARETKSSSASLSLSLSYHAEILTISLTILLAPLVMHSLLRAALRAPPSPSDKAGTFYIYEICGRQPNRPIRRAQAKLGRAKDPSKRKLQWFRKCRGQRQRWWCYWRVPFAAKFERLIHLHFKLRGAWLGRQPCDFCPTKHQEKYDLEACGGRAGVRAAVELYLGLLRWRILRVDM
ncbi:hypothetical protein B0H15DRAFT_973675 [Mycena belliarum]|uniref:Bacteriophage T5 Orf172 DNA-binding domain-containing protein n=1 Tax=Mycena belliarum TaxID=1033014 RepID=A0AAD6XFK1_9AGAR|nr:hypothetical protein B0H15DRAFT_973675 [Mycena belliae]